MKPYSSSAVRVLVWIFATTTKTCSTETGKSSFTVPISRVPAHNNKHLSVTLRFPHVPTGTSRSFPQASFFSAPPTTPHQQSPSCCNTIGTPASIVLETSYNTPTSPPADCLLLWQQLMKAKGERKKCSKNVMCHRSRLEYWFGNNGNYFIQNLTLNQYWRCGKHLLSVGRRPLNGNKAKETF